MSKKLLRTSLVILTTSLLVACSSLEEKVDDETYNWTAAQLYDAARENVRDSNWTTANVYLGAIATRFPYTSYAQQAMIDQAYVNWKDDESEKAIAVIDRFMALYPNHPHADYMLYLKGLITFTPPSAFLSSYTGQDPSERDPKGLRQSYDAFKMLIDNFPQSTYADDARQRLVWLVSTIAQNEVNVARYYYERHGYVAAINRAQTVLTDFTGVKAAEPALYIMMKSYEALNLPDQANDARRVLEQNYPNSQYIENGFDKDHGWFGWLKPANWFTSD